MWNLVPSHIMIECAVVLFHCWCCCCFCSSAAKCIQIAPINRRLCDSCANQQAKCKQNRLPESNYNLDWLFICFTYWDIRVYTFRCGCYPSYRIVALLKLLSCCDLVEIAIPSTTNNPNERKNTKNMMHLLMQLNGPFWFAPSFISPFYSYLLVPMIEYVTFWQNGNEMKKKQAAWRCD